MFVMHVLLDKAIVSDLRVPFVYMHKQSWLHSRIHAGLAIDCMGCTYCTYVMPSIIETLHYLTVIVGQCTVYVHAWCTVGSAVERGAKVSSCWEHLASRLYCMLFHCTVADKTSKIGNR